MSPDCLRVLECLGAPLPPELAAHRDTCAECQALQAGFSSLDGPLASEPPPAVPPALERARTRALEELAAHPVARPWWHEALRLLGVSLGVIVLAALGSWHAGKLLNTSPPAVLLGLTVLVLLAMGAGTLVALIPARRLGVAGVAMALSAAGVAVAMVLGGSGVKVHGFLEGCLGCVRTGLLLSALPVLMALSVLRRLAFQTVRAMAAGLAAGAVGLVLVHLRCPEGGVSHLAVSHVGPWLLMGALVPWVRSHLRTRVHAP